ncbi:virulence RhuM family protein [Fibrobacter sp.]|uniref:virulence RhuM family protein n=1 Tax=Fibrobacter sp. TaxID=35828 RepID=UPI00388FA36B
MKKDVAASAAGADKNEIVVYQPEGGEFHIEVRVENESVWLTQAQMAELFHATKQNISLHIANIYKEGELDRNSVVKEYLTTASDGKCYKTKWFNLDVIISVGYRIKSIQGTRFRQWALNILKEYMLKGYAVNQRMLAPQTQQKMFENVNTRLTAVEQRVDFFVNTAHSAQNQRIEQLSNDVQKVMKNFVDPSTFKHFLILNGKRLEADVAYTQIYGMAKRSVLIVDDYLDVKTLDLLRCVAKGVSVKIFSEQHGRTRLTESMLADFRAARPDVELGDVRATGNVFHDRYIYLDFGTGSEKLFHCGASSKDAGNKITTIMQLEDIAGYRTLFGKLLREGE